jgi:hypothetical protein
MTPAQRNLLARLRNIPRRFADEADRRRQRSEQGYIDRGYVRKYLDRVGRLRDQRRQRNEQGYIDRGYMRKYLDRVGRLRDQRLVEVNSIRFEKKIPHLLRSTPGPLGDLDWSARRINALASQFPRWREYLEIGIFEGRTFEQVNIRHRVGVDPRPLFDLAYLPRGCEVEVLTSDAYFEKIAKLVNFDMAFIDGLHTAEQTYRDIINAFQHVTSGPVLIDDTVPLDEISAIPDQEESYRVRAATGLEGHQWHGDVWRTVLILDRHHPELEWRTITDRGNPQTLVWRRRTGAEVRSATPEQLADVMKLSYVEVFANGTPESFQPVLEDEALRACVAGLRTS